MQEGKERLRWVKVEFSKVTQTKETAVKVEGPIKPTVAQV